MTDKNKYDRSNSETEGDDIVRPTPGKAEGSREDVEATLRNQSKYQGGKGAHSEHEKGKGRKPGEGNVSVGRTPGKAEGDRKTVNDALRNQEKGNHGSKRR